MSCYVLSNELFRCQQIFDEQFLRETILVLALSSLKIMNVVLISMYFRKKNQGTWRPIKQFL